ncbi:MAG: nitroreductase family protein [Ruminococcus sp.]|nr:nitroreductase family protein [Ruminococcus sp.]
MNTLENLYSRKSIRSYNGENITEAELKEILKAACAAPVGRAKYETLTLTVISNADYLSRWEEATAVFADAPGLHPFYGAPTVILVSSIVPPAPQDNVSYSNAAIIVQNMALAAVELGIGACHIWGAVRALNESPELIRELNLPDEMVPCCAIALGHMDEKYVLRAVQDDRIRTDYMR